MRDNFAEFAKMYTQKAAQAPAPSRQEVVVEDSESSDQVEDIVNQLESGGEQSEPEKAPAARQNRRGFSFDHPASF